MVRFALTITAVMLALTVGAAVWIFWTEAPAGVDYLRAEDLSNIGMKPVDFRSERASLTGGVAAHVYRCGFADSLLTMRAEALIGSPPSRYEEELARRQADAKAEQAGETAVLKTETFGREAKTPSFCLVKTRLRPEGGEVFVEWWIQEGDDCFHAELRDPVIAPEQFAERRDWCERQARTIAHVMLGCLREALSR